MRTLLCAVLVAGSFATAGTGSLREAEDLYLRTDYEASLALLDKQNGDAATDFLIGRDYYMLGDFKKAQDYLQKATALDATKSEYMNWLGRAYGKRAEIANPLMAPSFASKSRQAFEKAVALDPTNTDALDDLFDYYLEAPGFLGGGYEKAEKVAEQLSKVDPGQGYHDKAKLDQKRKAFDSAERHLREAVAAAPHSVGHMVALAKFLATQGRNAESDAVFAQAQKVSPDNPRIWLAQADVYVKQKRNLQEAKALLLKYVRSPITADDPPREEALRLLKQMGGA